MSKSAKSGRGPTRRRFLQTSVAGSAGLIFLPRTYLVGAQTPPSRRITVAQIGCGRMGMEDLRGTMAHDDLCRIVAVCDLDGKRLETARTEVEQFYRKKGETTVDVKAYRDFHEVLARKDIDAVVIAAPYHWHAYIAIAACEAGKDIYCEKPLSLTIHEARAMVNAARKYDRVFQTGSMQRSSKEFRIACELVRNGRIGKLHTVKIGLPVDPSGDEEPEMPIPPNLDYAMWLGWTPQVPYTEKRVHPQNSITDRPGWLRIDSYCLGMITGWGSHHVDIGHWGMGTELTGPIEIEGKAEFPRKGLWNVHGPYHIEAKYANGATMIIDNNFTNGVRFEGADGWIFVSRGGAQATASDPASAFGKALDASDPKILNSKLGPNELHLHKSDDHHLDWLTSIQTRQPAVTTPEEAHRSTSACEIGWIAMKLGRKLRWDPAKEAFLDDDQANAMRSRPQRAPYGANLLLQKI